MRNYLIGASAAAALALGFCSVSQAAVITVLSAGELSPASGAVITFESLPQTAYGATTPAGTFTSGNAAFSGDGIIMNNAGQDSLGLYAEPYHNQSNYLAILGGQSETITLSSL